MRNFYTIVEKFHHAENVMFLSDMNYFFQKYHGIFEDNFQKEYYNNYYALNLNLGYNVILSKNVCLLPYSGVGVFHEQIDGYVSSQGASGGSGTSLGNFGYFGDAVPTAKQFVSGLFLPIATAGMIQRVNASLHGRSSLTGKLPMPEVWPIPALPFTTPEAIYKVIQNLLYLCCTHKKTRGAHISVNASFSLVNHLVQNSNHLMEDLKLLNEILSL
jgi:hypothetical protein